MASFVFNKFKADLMKGTHQLSATNDTYSVALVVTSAAFTPAASANADITSAWSDLSATWGIVGKEGYSSTEYTVKGLSGCTVSANNGNDKSVWDASDVTWPSSTIDADGAVIYRTSDGFMVCAMDFGSKKSSSNGDFTVQWNAAGILNLA